MNSPLTQLLKVNNLLKTWVNSLLLKNHNPLRKISKYLLIWTSSSLMINNQTLINNNSQTWTSLVELILIKWRM
jgi:hypothetical protein